MDVTRGLISASLILQVLSSGMFEIAVLSIYNGNSRRADGYCCSGSGDTCNGECSTFVTSCLMQHTTFVPEVPDCIFGNTSSPVLGGDIVRTDGIHNYLPMKIRFHFSWPAMFTLVVDARNDLQLSQNESSQIILRSILSQTLYPPSLWYTETKTTSDKSIQYKYRVICDENYFGAGCEVFCRHRNDSFGHYVCDGDGTKLCLPGWEGEFCESAMCWDRCNMSHGFCKEPFKCSCMVGWDGESCDQCIRSPDCTNGYCHEPEQCICLGDWTGPNCNIDINYCNKYDPCENGGICIGDREKNFTCQCSEFFTGLQCESVLCFEGSCQNGGNCSNASVGCECSEKYYGPQCEFRKLTCDETECMNGGTCIPTTTGTMCICNRGYTGENCKSEIDECESSPCQYGGVCNDGIAGYICLCKDGYMGRNCDIVMNPCMGITCFHGGTCVSIGYLGTCVCKPGNTGYRCEIVLDPCSNIECQHGGQCTTVSSGFGFQCLCQPGYNGVHCEVQSDPCQYVDCANGGTCKSYTDHYECICDPHYGGKHCKTLLMASDQPDENTPSNIIKPVVKVGTNSANRCRLIDLLSYLFIVICIL